MTNEKQLLIAAIVRVDNEIKDTKSKLKDRRLDARQLVAELDESKALEAALIEIEKVKNELKAAIAQSKELQAVFADIEDTAFKLKDLGEILSHHLVAYYEETGDKFVVEGVDDRPIILTAKLGKREPHQESMFDKEATS